MAHTLTNFSTDLISRLIQSGRFNNQSEVVRAGLRLLEEKEFGYLNPPTVSSRALERAYRRQKTEATSEAAAARASRRRAPRFDE